MDPLSITASSIAVLGAIAGTGRGIGKLISLRNAPIELQALANEVEALRSLLVIIQSSIRQIQQSDTYADFREALYDLLTRTEKAILELQTMVEFELRKGVEFDQDGLPKISRSAWLRYSGKIERSRAKIRDARDNLSTGLQAINIHMSETTRQTVVQIQSISTTVLRQATVGASDGSRPTASPANIGTTEQSDADSTISQTELQPALEQPLAVNRQDSINEHSVIQVTTSITTQRCARFCPCQCHKRSHVRSPEWLKAIVGQMFCSHNGLLRTTPCDYPRCRQSSRKTEFTYLFPQWLARRAMIMSTASDLSGCGAKISVAMPIVIGEHERIWFAILSGNIALVQRFFTDGYNPYMVNSKGENLLAVAIVTQQQAISKFLLQQGAKHDWQDSYGTTPMTRALLNYQTSSLRDFALDPEDIVEHMNFSSLHTAVVLQSLSAEGYERLLGQEYMHLNEVDRLGMTPLHWAVRTGNFAAVRSLISWTANVNAQDSHGWTPLHEACNLGDISMIEMLIDAGANVNTESRVGQTPIFAVDEPGCGIVSLLEQHGADINHRDHDGFSVLHNAACWGQSRIIDELISHGADVDALDFNGRTPMQRAIVFDEIAVVSALLESSGMRQIPIHWNVNRYGGNALHDIALYAGVDIMRALANANLAGLDPTLPNNAGDTLDECFMHYRDNSCTIIRAPFAVEQEAWHILLLSACAQNGIDPETLGLIIGVSSNDEDQESEDGEDGEDDEDEDSVQDAFVDAQETPV